MKLTLADLLHLTVAEARGARRTGNAGAAEQMNGITLWLVPR